MGSRMRHGVPKKFAYAIYALLFMFFGVAYAGTEVGSFTSPLSPTLGGTGNAGGYTTGDILHATGASTIGKLADVGTGQVLTSGGVGVVPAYSAAPTVTSITLSGNTAKSFVYSDASKVAVTTSAPTNGQLLIGDTGNIPQAAAITAGTGISVTNGAHSITIATTGGGARTVTAKTTGYTVLSGDAGVVFTNTGAAGTVIFTLPTAAAGLTYTFVVDAVFTVELLAGASTTIQVGGTISSSAGNFQNAVSGSTITVVAISTTQWVALSATGSWTGV